MNGRAIDCSNYPAFDNHEAVYITEDSSSGLRAVIAIHSTARGPAAGGCRAWFYADVENAVDDALRLSKGMSYKNAMADLPFGGGKAVILVEPGARPTAQQFRAFGQFVQSLGGRYVTAEDVGVNIQDMLLVQSVTKYVTGLPQNGNLAGGDPSPWTALGVFLSIQQSLEHLGGSPDLQNTTVAVQGVGHVGYILCRLLHCAGASLTVADINRKNAERARRDFDAALVSPHKIISAPADIFAPCALGAVLTESTIPKLYANIVAGAANNQLESPLDGMRLHEQGKLFLPDYVINAGGIIAVAREYLGDSSTNDVDNEISKIPVRLGAILAEADKKGVPPNDIANQQAQAILQRAKATNGSCRHSHA